MMESLVHYSNPSNAPSLLAALNEQRLSGQMCDTVLVVGEQKYQAHKSVLAASSEYFQSLFAPEDREDQKMVQLDFCEPDAFEIVLNYIYSSSLFVDKGSLAAIQELGYSLGIPFLTNIVSTRPHVSYCVSRKRLSFSEENENDGQTRSVIVCQVQSNPGHSNYENKTPKKVSLPQSTRGAALAESQPRSQAHNFNNLIRNSEFKKSAEIRDHSEKKSTYPYSSILKGNSSHTSSVRPQLTTSVSFSDAETQHSRLQPGNNLGTKEEEDEEDSLYHRTKGPLQGKKGEPVQTVDRSGPLIKSLLRRSLSMDSPVPVFSPTLELKDQHQSVVRMASKASGPESSEHNGDSKRSSPLVLRSKHPSWNNEVDAQVDGDVCVKAEPSSPLADPMEIVRITVGETLPVYLKDFQSNYDQGSMPNVNLFGKRKVRADNRRYPFKKSRALNEHFLPLDETVSETETLKTSVENHDNDMEPDGSKLFKCWNCLKVFRSNAGLHRHVNMYHNPEKPYACDICQKRFHTNFKVWTHCQTQHGVVQNPASSSSSPMLDEKFQKKLIDIVREREIKKALLWKLKRNKQSLQPSTKKRPRHNFICPYCGKVFLFQSQYKQHLRTHPAENVDEDMARESALFSRQSEMPDHKNTEEGVYSCRLCNVKLSSLFEQGDHERGCRYATVCPYCGLRFSNSTVKKDHEAHCKYKKLTCLECMRTFKSSFSIWRHQVEVHNHNMMTVKDQINLKLQENNGEDTDILRQEHCDRDHVATGSAAETATYSNSLGPPTYDSEDSSSYVPEDLSMGRLVMKEEPMEEAVSDMESAELAKIGSEEPGVWPCEKCGNLFSCHKDLERHQELLCHIKPFICHICNKAFRTNFRLWSHYQSHMTTADGDSGSGKEVDRRPSSSPSPSPPLTAQTMTTGRPAPLVHPSKPAQATPPVPLLPAVAAEDPGSPEPSGSSESSTKRPEVERQRGIHSPLSRSNSMDNPAGPQESDTLFYHAPTLSALTFKRQYMCKLCHRTFKTAFSLWSHEHSHSHS